MVNVQVSMPRNQVFISYSRKDQVWLERLKTMLQPLIHNQVISVWDDTQIQAGTQREAEIQNALTAAKVAVLMVSPDFLASNFIANHELPHLLEAAQREELTILWVYVRHCLYDQTEVRFYQSAHDDISQPLNSLSDHECDQVLKSICQRIERAANQELVIPEPNPEPVIPEPSPVITNQLEPVQPERKKPLQIFLACASEDINKVEEIFNKLKEKGYKPWLYNKSLTGGQNWRQEIPEAIKNSDIFIACFSANSVRKQGYVQREYKLAVEEYAKRKKKENPRKIFIIPLRLDECELPNLTSDCGEINLQDIHRIDYWRSDGFNKLMQAIENAAIPIVWSRIKNVINILLISLGIGGIGISLSVYLIKYLIPVPKILPSSPPPLSASPSASPSHSLLVDACNNTPDFISCGEKSDFLNYPKESPSLTEETEGRKEFAAGHYDKAVNFLQKAWDQEKDPTTLIALNNARVMNDLKTSKLSSDKVFSIAISSGFDATPEGIGGSILTGIAWRQDEFNSQHKNNFGLIVVMADDKNDKNQTVSVARELVKRKEILGVIGPYSSHATYYVIDEYRKEKLVLVSATSTATVEAYKAQDKNKSQDLSWFFRPVPTTRIGAEHLVKYLQKKGYQQVIIFYQGQDLFAISFYNDVTKKLEDSIIKKVKEINIDKIDKSQIDKAIASLKGEFNQVKDKTALILLTDAYTKAQSKSKKLEVINANNGEFFIAGNNTLFDTEILGLVGTIGKESLGKMAITIPWYPSTEQSKKMEHFVGKNVKTWAKNDAELIWQMAMSYDATEMLIKAILQQPTREGIQNILANSNFSVEGLTGEITLEGPDREDQFSSLIRPDCSTNPCGWLEIDKYSSRK